MSVTSTSLLVVSRTMDVRYSRYYVSAVVSSGDTAPTHNCELFLFVVSFVLTGLTCTLGIAGNYLSVLTLGRDRSLRTSVTKFLLTVLAVVDLAFLIPVIIVIMLPAYCSYGKLRTTCVVAVHQAILYIKQYGWAVASASHTCTVYITVLVAIHRYIYVCCSHKAKQLSTLHRAKIHVAVVLVFAFCYNLPRIFEYRIQYPTSNSTSGCSANLSAVYNQTDNGSSDVGKLQFTEIGINFWFKYVYKNICYCLVMYVVPLSTLVFVTVRLLATIRRRRRAAAAVDKRSTTVHCRQQARDDSVTVVLIIVIVVFIVCQTPTLIQRLMLALTGNSAFDCGRAYFYVEIMADYLAVFNSCVNFGIYVVFAPHFRRILFTDVLKLRGSRRSRRRRGQVDGGTGRSRARATEVGTAAAMMNCAKKCTTAAAAPSSVATASGQDGSRDDDSSHERTGRRYSSERAECIAISSPTPSSHKQQHQQQQHERRQLYNDTEDDIILNGVTGAPNLPLKPLLSRQD